MIPTEGDYLTPGKKSLPIAVLNNTCKKHFLTSTPYPYPPYNTGGKGKGKDWKGKDGKYKGKKEPPQAALRAGRPTLFGLCAPRLFQCFHWSVIFD